MIAFKIKEDIYGIPIHITIGEWKECQEFLHKKYNTEKVEQEFYGGCCDFYTEKGFSFVAIWLPEYDYNNIDDIVTLIHEIDHAVFHIFNHIDIPILDNSSNHAYIYLKEYFSEKALTKLKRLQNDK